MFSIPVLGLLWMTSVPGQSFEGDLPELSEQERVSSDFLVQHISIVGARPHNIKHFKALEDVALYIEEQLIALDYTVELQPFSVGNQTVRNIEAVIEPASSDAETLIVGAHYDSFGKSHGANDNGSGVAAVLELARQLKDLDGNGGLRLRLVFFVNEEPPYFKTEYMGSAVYAKALIKRDEKFFGMLSLETMGYFSDKPNSQKYPPPLSFLYPQTGNFIAIVGDSSARPFVRKTVGDFRAVAKFPSVGGTAPAFVQGIDWSDHRSFSAVDIPALMVTDTAAFRYPQYHSRRDTPEKVDSERLARVVSGLAKVIRTWSEAEQADSSEWSI